MNIALWILPCLALACAGSDEHPVTPASASPKTIPCDHVFMHPEFYTDTERIRCEYDMTSH